MKENLRDKVGMKGYLALAAAILFFSGLFMNAGGMHWLSAFDFSTLSGKFGTMKAPDKATFVGTGGIGARGGFLFALSLVPSVMLALGCMEVLTHYGAIRAAQRLLTPLLKPLLGIPGLTGLALITDLQSTDAGAALTKELYDNRSITKKDLVVMTGWQYSGAGLLSNYFSIGSGFFAFLLVPIFIPLAIMFVLKFTGAIFVRFMLNTLYKNDFIAEENTEE